MRTVWWALKEAVSVGSGMTRDGADVLGLHAIAQIHRHECVSVYYHASRFCLHIVWDFVQDKK